MISASADRDVLAAQEHFLPSLPRRMALAAVVTEAVLEEFKILKLSFELFHGAGFTWYVRCCGQVKAALSTDEFIHCKAFTKTHRRRLDTDDPGFNSVVEQKMHAIEDAWAGGDFEAVMFLDADIIVTSPFAEDVLLLGGDLVLTPHHWHPARRADSEKYGHFNSGFVFTRNRNYHLWWHHAFLSQPSKFTDQQCLDEAPAHFRVHTLSEEANVGFWRAENGTTRLNEVKIPPNCSFLHTHLFQPAEQPVHLVSQIFAQQYIAFTLDKDIAVKPFSWYQLQVKAFALCCLCFLKMSLVPQHHQLYRAILAADPLGLYSSILEPLPRGESQLTTSNAPSQ